MEALADMSWSSTAFRVLFLYVAYLMVRAIHNLSFHPLSTFPGPPLRCAFSFPSVLEVCTGRSIQNTHELHKRYGYVVRIAPDALSFSSAQAWKDIYGFQQNRRQILKDYKRFPDVKDALPILNSNDVDHARMRKLMSHAFSDTALREQLPLVARHMQKFVDQVRKKASRDSDHNVDINEWFNYLAFDIITDLSFGEPLGALESGAPDQYINGFLKACKMFVVVPMMHEYSLFNLFFKMMMQVPAVKRSQEIGYVGTKAKVERRMGMKTERKDFMTYILRHNDEKGMTTSEIIGSTTVLVNAGGEATAGCMSAAVYYMLQNPRVYKKAKDQVRDAFVAAEDIMSTTSHGLTYLNAVIEETLRIYAPAPGNFSRRTDVSTEIDGKIVPPNTSVGVHQYSAGHSAHNFAQPESFIPERWLKSPPVECQEDVKAAMQPWAIGPRNCLGKNVAYLEMRIALALVLWLFDLELCKESNGWAETQTYNIVWNRGPLLVRLSPRRTM